MSTLLNNMSLNMNLYKTLLLKPLAFAIIAATFVCIANDSAISSDSEPTNESSRKRKREWDDYLSNHSARAFATTEVNHENNDAEKNEYNALVKNFLCPLNKTMDCLRRMIGNERYAGDSKDPIFSCKKIDERRLFLHELIDEYKKDMKKKLSHRLREETQELYVHQFKDIIKDFLAYKAMMSSDDPNDNSIIIFHNFISDCFFAAFRSRNDIFCSHLTKSIEIEMNSLSRSQIRVLLKELSDEGAENEGTKRLLSYLLMPVEGRKQKSCNFFGTRALPRERSIIRDFLTHGKGLSEDNCKMLFQKQIKKQYSQDLESIGWNLNLFYLAVKNNQIGVMKYFFKEKMLKRIYGETNCEQAAVMLMINGRASQEMLSLFSQNGFRFSPHTLSRYLLNEAVQISSEFTLYILKCENCMDYFKDARPPLNAKTLGKVLEFYLEKERKDDARDIFLAHSPNLIFDIIQKVCIEFIRGGFNQLVEEFINNSIDNIIDCYGSTLSQYIFERISLSKATNFEQLYGELATQPGDNVPPFEGTFNRLRGTWQKRPISKPVSLRDMNAIFPLLIEAAAIQANPAQCIKG